MFIFNLRYYRISYLKLKYLCSHKLASIWNTNPKRSNQNTDCFIGPGILQVVANLFVCYFIFVEWNGKTRAKKLVVIQSKLLISTILGFRSFIHQSCRKWKPTLLWIRRITFFCTLERNTDWQGLTSTKERTACKFAWLSTTLLQNQS